MGKLGRAGYGRPVRISPSDSFPVPALNKPEGKSRGRINMFKKIVVHANFNERTGYGIHASSFFPLLEKMVKEANGTGEVHISLYDVVTASQVKERHPYPSILFNVWESTEYPKAFMENLKLYDQLWVPSEWQKEWSVKQGIPEDFIRVVPEGVDPKMFYPVQCDRGVFTFIHVGQWQPRKSTREIVATFLSAFPDEKNVRLKLLADTIFPSDSYNSTEERLAAFGLTDERIQVVHFESRKDYVSSLQKADCFVSCSRAEGWGLPIIEAMSCGIPTIVCDWSGSTEYAGEAIKVPYLHFVKPYGIYGGWDVPGLWCEPDFAVLAKKMKDVFENYYSYKEKAVELSKKIRSDFSWEAAARKAFNILEELHSKMTESSIEADIISYAYKKGYRIEKMEKERIIFAIGCWPNSSEKMATLVETINQAKLYNFPILITTHYPIPASVIELVDYVIYDKKNVLSGEWHPTYTRVLPNGSIEEKESRIPYHGVACLNAMRNAIDFCYEKFDRMIYLEYDAEVDIDAFLSKITKAPFTGIIYENTGIRTDIWSGDLNFLYSHFPIVSSWEEYTKDMKDLKTEYVLERYFKKVIGKHEINLIELDVTNRFDQVDRELWEDDLFEVSFFDGPCLNIKGISRREYDVSYYVGDEIIYTLKQKVGMWSKADTKFYVPWKIVASFHGEEKFSYQLDLRGKNVLIQFGSKALGDTVAWMPYVEEFRKLHGCNVICSCWWKDIFDYPEIQFVDPGSPVTDIIAVYSVGCFDNQQDKNPSDWRTVPLQKVAADILGIPYEPIRAKLVVKNNTNIKKPYVCFSEYSTMRGKFWNNEGAWQKLVDKISGLGLVPVSVSHEPSNLMNVEKLNGRSIEETISTIAGCEFYIGLTHGPAWLAYSLGKPVVMIAGMTEPWNEFPNEYRVSNPSACGVGCFNDTSVPIDRNFHWCPRNKNYACTREISVESVMKAVMKIVDDIHFGEYKNRKNQRRKKYESAEKRNIAESCIG